MKAYEMPIMEVIEVDEENVICTSSVIDIANDGQITNGGSPWIG